MADMRMTEVTLFIEGDTARSRQAIAKLGRPGEEHLPIQAPGRAERSEPE
jgi:hypothetical protein